MQNFMQAAGNVSSVKRYYDEALLKRTYTRETARGENLCCFCLFRRNELPINAELCLPDMFMVYKQNLQPHIPSKWYNEGNIQMGILNKTFMM